MKIESRTHFGLEIKPRTRGFRLTRDNFITFTNRSTFGKDEYYINALKSKEDRILKMYAEIYSDSEGRIYTDAQCERFRDEALRNFDLNMAFFSRLDRSRFNYEVDRFAYKTKFRFISDLKSCCYSGYYVMILDDYCQVYIGTANNIKERIQKHWGGGKMRLDRLVCGSENNSKLSIDSFRSLDTTRILVYESQETYTAEDKYIGFFSDDFVCNRARGGRLLSEEPFSIDAIDKYKFRTFE